MWAAIGCIIWGIWKWHNDMVFNNKKWHPDAACQLAISDARDFLEANKEPNRTSGVSQVSLEGVVNKWKKPCRGWVKINFDGGLDTRAKIGGLGMVVRDSDGSFRAARAIHSLRAWRGSFGS